MVVNGVGYLGKACLRAEAVRFCAFGNLTLVAATIIVHLLLVLIHFRVLSRVRRVLILLFSVNEYMSALCMMV